MSPPDEGLDQIRSGSPLPPSQIDAMVGIWILLVCILCSRRTKQKRRPILSGRLTFFHVLTSSSVNICTPHPSFTHFGFQSSLSLYLPLIVTRISPCICKYLPHEWSIFCWLLNPWINALASFCIIQKAY